MSITTAKTAAGLACALAVQAASPSAASADEYQYIVSGDPAVAATQGLVSGESSAAALDVRHYAVAESRAKALTSIKPTGFILIVR